MIRVLEIISDTNFGGAGSVLLNYLTHRDRRSFEVAVAMPRGSVLRERPELEGVPVFELANLRDKSFDIGAIRELRMLMRKYRPNIVHTHGALSGRIAAKREGIPAVFTKHSAFPPSKRLTRFPGKGLYKFITLRYADRIIAVAPVCADGLIACGVPPGHIEVIANGASPLQPPAGRALLRAKYCHDGTFLAGIISRVELYKGHDILLKAAQILRSRGRDVLFLIAGTGSFETDAKRLAQSLGVEDCVRFLGFVEDVPSLMGVLDVQVNASRVEGCSMSLIQGMSLGVPAVASNAGGNPMLIRDGKNGLLFESEDPQALADNIELLMSSLELRKALSRGARAIYDSEYTGERTARETENVYRRVAARN